MVGSHTDPETFYGRHHFGEPTQNLGYSDDLYGDQHAGVTAEYSSEFSDGSSAEHGNEHSNERGNERGDAQSGDQSTGKLFRAPPYVLTNGRTRPSTPLDMLSLVRATGRTRPEHLSVAHGKALEWCQKPVSVAEIAAHLGQPLNVTKILLSDLIEIGAAIAKYPPPDTAYVNDPAILEAVLDGLRKLK